MLMREVGLRSRGVRRLGGSLLALGAALALQAGTPAMAQGQGEEDVAAPEDANATGDADWFRICEDAVIEGETVQHCYVQADLVSEGTLVGSLAVDQPTEGVTDLFLRMLWPLGLLLAPGFAFQIDDSPLQRGLFEYCGPLPGERAGCLSRGPIDEAFIDLMKAGDSLVLQVFPPTQQEPIVLTIGLAGFTEAYDGPPSAPADVPDGGAATEPPVEQTEPPAE